MKKRHWLTLSEELLLVGSGVGSVASVVSQQITYAVAPVSVLLFLNLLNRRRFEKSSQQETRTMLLELDQRLSHDIGTVRQQVLSLPSRLDLTGLKKTIQQKNQETLTEFSIEMRKRLTAFEEQGLRQLRDDISQLEAQHSNILDTLNNVTSYLHRLVTSARVDHLESTIAKIKSDINHLQGNLQALVHEPKPNLTPLQDQINHINRRLNTLPPPGDTSSVRQDVESLIKLIGDLVPRREMAKIQVDMEQIQKHQSTLEQSTAPVKLAVTILKKQVEDLYTKTRTKSLEELSSGNPSGGSNDDLTDQVTGLQLELGMLEQRLNQLPSNSDLVGLREELQREVAVQQEQLQQQIAATLLQFQDTQQRYASQNGKAAHIPEEVDSQLKGLVDRIEGLENKLKRHSNGNGGGNGGNRGNQHQGYSSNPDHPYEMVFALKQPSAQGQGLFASEPDSARRSLLLDVFDQAETEMLIVWPWLNPENFSSLLLQQFREFLNRSGKIEIGLGHLENASKGRSSHFLDQRWGQEGYNRDAIHQALNQLIQLKRDYPKQFKFKVLGTDENFIVCDRNLAILGVQTLTTASTVFPGLEVGLRTTAPQVIEGLLNRFRDPALEPDDALAFFSRGETRYALGDKAGALSDYTQAIQLAPKDDIAYNNRGIVHYELNNRQAALFDFEEALRINSRNTTAYCNRGFTQAELGDTLGAIEDYSRALRINPELSMAYFYRGIARTRLGNKQGAIEDYSEVIRLDPKAAIAYFYRALARIKLSDKAGALEDLEQATELFEQQGQKANYQKALDMLVKLQNVAQATPVLVAGEATL